MFKCCSLYSGSSGNSFLVSNNDTNILVDAGVSAKKILEALNTINISINGGLFVYAGKSTSESQKAQEIETVKINSRADVLILLVAIYQIFTLDKGVTIKTVAEQIKKYKLC